MKNQPAPIFVTRRLPPAAIDLLRSQPGAFELHDSDEPLAPDRLRDACIGRSAVVCLVPDRFDAELLAVIAPTCRVLATVSVGFDHIDAAAAARLGVTVTNTPDVLTETTADLTWALMLATARRLGEAERVLRAGRWPGWSIMQFLGTDVHGATLGIVGGGRIGSAVARRAMGFNMRVLCCTPRPQTSRMPPEASFVDLHTLLRESDFVSLHAPMSAATRRLIGATELALMKPTSILINTSRGPLVDEASLVVALRERRIAAAGLDVYEREPVVSPELLTLENVVLLPHIGSASLRTRNLMGTTAVQSVLDVLAGRRPRHVVLPAAGETVATA